MHAIDPWAPADPLAEALHHLRMNGAFSCRSELTAPWGFALMPMPGYLWFHMVTSGQAWLETVEGEPALLRPGELALVPHGEGHRVRGEPGAPAPDILELDLERVPSPSSSAIRPGPGRSRRSRARSRCRARRSPLASPSSSARPRCST